MRKCAWETVCVYPEGGAVMVKEERDVDLLQLAKVLWKNVKYIIAATLVLALLGLLGSALLMTPIYEANAKMIVNTRSDKDENLTNDQLNSAKNLVDTYAVIITSRDVLNRVIEELNLNMTYDQLKACIRVQAVDDTQVMEIVVQHSNAGTALAVAGKILEFAPSVLVETVEAGSVKPVEQAHVGSDPVSPKILKNTVIMAAVGFMLACIVIIVVFFMDTTYKSELDIQNDLNLPVLGVIPTVESCKNQSGYGQRRSSGKSAKGSR